ncbi:TBC1 domain family member 31 isoform X3 [Rhynchophorus ferrugineus]|uniref:TBC1 domain family member 31 isoform X3 n=1 Tax=Rhynchophorus ferrugineus TaxID=354439 RepID=UPI003FCCF4A7
MDKIITSKDVKYEETKYYLNIKAPNNEGLILSVQETKGKKGIRFIYCDFHINGDILALGNTDYRIYFIDFKKKRYWALKQLDHFTCIKLCEYNDSHIFIGKANGVIDIIEIDFGKVISKLIGHEYPALSISFSQDICISASKYEAIIWDLTSSSKLQILSLEKHCTLKFVHIIPIFNNILVCYKDDIIQIWDINTLKSLKQFLPSNWKNYSVKSIAFSKNGKTMVVSGYLPILAIFQLNIWKLLKLNNILETDKLKAIIREYEEFPEAYRFIIWEKILKLPNNVKQYSSLINHVNIVAFKDLVEKFHLEDKVTVQCFKHVFNNIVTWCPFFAQVDFLPLFLFPFIKVSHKKPITCFELCCTLLINWCQHWFEYHPLPPINILAIIDNVLMEHDITLMQHYADNNINANVYCWLLLESAFSEVLNAPQWLKFWDHVFINEPAYLLCAVVAYNILQRKHLLLFTNEYQIQNFFHCQQPVDIKGLIKKTYIILNNTSITNHPRQYLEEFRGLSCGSYPIFEEYPKDVVNFQSEQITYLREQLKQIQNIKDELSTTNIYGENRYQEQEIKNEEERRMIDVEKECMQKIKDYQSRLQCQQEELTHLRDKLCNTETHILNTASRKLRNHASTLKAGVLEALVDGLDVSENVNKSEIARLRDDAKEKYLNLLRKEQNLEELIEPKLLSSDISKELNKAYKDTLKVKREIKKTKRRFKTPSKTEVYLTISLLNTLMEKIKKELANEYKSCECTSVMDNLKIVELQRETKALQKEVTQLVSLLGEKTVKTHSSHANKNPNFVQFHSTEMNN